MKISIITVTYNSAATIRDTLESVKKQDYPNIEHIIIDGASTDNTLQIVKEYPSVSRIVSEPDSGIYDAMNKGIKIATGNIIGILNSDDIFADNSIIGDVAKVFERTKIDAVYGNLSYFRSGEEHKVVRLWRTKPYYERFFEDGELPPHPTLYVRKEIYDEIGVFRADYKIAADIEFMLRLLKVKKAQSFFLDKIMVKMRLGGASTSGLKSYWTVTLETKRLWAENGLTYPFKLYFIRPLKKIQQLIRLGG